MNTKATILLAAALLCATARAEFINGNTLLERMNGGVADKAHALGYVVGVADAGFGVVWCPPAGVTAGQALDVTRRVLEAVPEHRHNPADAFVRVALKQIAPCPANNKPSSTERGI